MLPAPAFNISNPILGSIYYNDKKKEKKKTQPTGNPNLINFNKRKRKKSNNNNNEEEEEDDDNNDITSLLIHNYLKNSGIENYSHLFKTGGSTGKGFRKLQIKHHHSSLYDHDINTKSNLDYFCPTCKLGFKNNKSHDFIMYNKCPNVKNNNCFMLETIYEVIHNRVKYVIKPDLSEAWEITEDVNDKRIYITNCLFIQCPICTQFKPNCIIQKCGHGLCKSCLNSYLQSVAKAKNVQCWMCRQNWDKTKNIMFTLHRASGSQKINFSKNEATPQ